MRHVLALIAAGTPFALLEWLADPGPIQSAIAAVLVAGAALLWEYVYRLRAERQRQVPALEDRPTDPGEQ